ncbi:MAG TPA: glycosyltransferase family 4 protein [Terriglobales bacterium]|nr:glycosyltransferase family 4 protein [Terriglobales bacterium]
MSAGTWNPEITKKGKVVHLTSVHGPLNFRIFYKECVSLREAGYEVVEVAPAEKDVVVEGVQIRAIRKPKRRILRMVFGPFQVYQHAMREDGDVYQFHDPELIPVALLLRARGKTVVYDVHEDVPGTIAYKFYLPATLRRLLVPIARWVEDSAAAHLSAIAAATDPIAERFAQNNERTISLHNFPILSEFASCERIPWRNRDIAVSYVGATMTRARGIVEVVEAIGYVPKQLSARLALAGRFSNDGLREQLVNSPGWKYVDEMGFLPREGVAELLARTRVGLVVLHPEPNYLRSRPVKLFEYMAAGVPVIASNFPDWRSIVEGGGCGLLVSPQDPKEIAEAIEFLLTHPEVAEKMGQNGREAVERLYVWDAEKEKLFALYNNLLARSQ